MFWDNGLVSSNAAHIIGRSVLKSSDGSESQSERILSSGTHLIATK